MASAPTVRDVAARAGVSRQTVSNVFNAPDRVDPRTMAKVLTAVEALGYRPNRSARSLKTRNAELIGYCVPSRPAGPLMDTFLHALCDAAEAANRHVLLFTAGEGDMAAYQNLIAQQAVDAFVLSDAVDDDPRHRWLTERKIRYASFGRTWPAHGEQPGPWVDVDGAAAIHDIVTGLVALGHQRIGFLGWWHGIGAMQDRLRGWHAACAEHRLPHGDPLVVRAIADTMADGRAAARRLLNLADPPTAIVAVSDVLALGVCQELAGRGLVPGEDVAVTGFDDTMLASVVEPGLTTVRQPVERIAEALVRSLVDGENVRVLLRGEIVSRASAPIPTPTARSVT